MAKKPDFKTNLVTKSGTKKGSVTLNPEIFGVRINKKLLNLALTAYAANRRQGNASTKERADVRGGGAKPWKQKGTGRARAGSTRSPIWRGGGTTFGPWTRDWRSTLPRTMRIEALRSALSSRYQSDDLTVLDDLGIEKPKTKEFVKILKALKLERNKTLIIVDKATEELKRATQNVATAKLRASADVSAYDILRKKKLIIDQKALPLLEERFIKKNQAPKEEKAKKTEAAEG